MHKNNTKLDDFGSIICDDERIVAHQKKCKALPKQEQALYWRKLYKSEPDLFKIMNGREYREYKDKSQRGKKRSD